jgi:phosphatidylglycerophosphatase A
MHDGKEIVIDELAGMWIALSICGINSENTLILAPLAFIFFRLFDIWKPSIIGKIDRDVKGGLGVMGDDIVAGFAAGIASAGIYQLLKLFIL